MTTRPQEEQTTEQMAYEQDRKMILNARYGKIAQPDNQTTEQRLADVRTTPAYKIMLLHRLILYATELKLYSLVKIYVDDIIKANKSLEFEIKRM